MQNPRFFIAYVLQGPGRAPTDALRARIAEEFGAKEALRYPPHVTLFTPFHSDKDAELRAALHDAASRLKPRNITFARFGAFGHDVWFLEPAEQKELVAMKSVVNDAVRRHAGIEDARPPEVTHFHLTLAFRDITPEQHAQIGALLAAQPLPATHARVDALSLLRRDEKTLEWSIAETAPFLHYTI